jgi:hypothetical protein
MIYKYRNRNQNLVAKNPSSLIAFCLQHFKIDSKYQLIFCVKRKSNLNRAKAYDTPVSKIIEDGVSSACPPLVSLPGPFF